MYQKLIVSVKVVSQSIYLAPSCRAGHLKKKFFFFFNAKLTLSLVAAVKNTHHHKWKEEKKERKSSRCLSVPSRFQWYASPPVSVAEKSNQSNEKRQTEPTVPFLSFFLFTYVYSLNSNEM